MSARARRGGSADIESLVELDAQVNPSPWSAAQFASACTGEAGHDETVLVMEEAGTVVGFLVISQVLDEACVQNFAVHPSCQRVGLGTALLQSALDLMREQQAVRCLLEVRESNTAARALYQRCGFAVDAVRKNYYPGSGGREDALLMSRQL